MRGRIWRLIGTLALTLAVISGVPRAGIGQAATKPAAQSGTGISGSVAPVLGGNVHVFKWASDEKLARLVTLGIATAVTDTALQDIITVFDTAKLREVGRVPFQPTALSLIAFDEGRSLAYVTTSITVTTPAITSTAAVSSSEIYTPSMSYLQNQLMAIDLTSGKLTRQFNIPGNATPRSLDVDQQSGQIIMTLWTQPNFQRTLVSLSSQGQISQQKPISGTADVELGQEAPFGVMFDQKHGQVITTNDYQGITPNIGNVSMAQMPISLTAYALPSFSSKWTASFPYQPARIIFDAASGNVWVFALGGHVTVLDGSSGQVRSEARLAVAPNGHNNQSFLVDGQRTRGYVSWTNAPQYGIDLVNPQAGVRQQLLTFTQGVGLTRTIGLQQSRFMPLGIDPASGRLIVLETRLNATATDYDRFILRIDGASGAVFSRKQLPALALTGDTSNIAYVSGTLFFFGPTNAYDDTTGATISEGIIYTPAP